MGANHVIARLFGCSDGQMSMLQYDCVAVAVAVIVIVIVHGPWVIARLELSANISQLSVHQLVVLPRPGC